ncbi:helix-turn-helix domain-containing protein [Mycoplasmopsis agassizii]|nr:helix-turn-helix domain-containing protein [Mycoplasmopsis agassizii]
MLYKRLGIQERFAIQILLIEGNNITEISRKLDKDK